MAVDERVVHLDLKGSPPTVKFLTSLFPRLREYGATGLLIEWEDMLPFDGALQCIRSDEHYTREEVSEILAAAASCGLEVIPLVQTFGHLEFVLKHDEFASLREDPDNYMDLCPEMDGSSELAAELIRQVVLFHPGIRMLHVGCDEVFGMGTCARCRLKIARSGVESLFLDFVEGVLTQCERLRVRPMLW